MNSIPKIFYQSWDSELPSFILKKNLSHIPTDIEYKLFSITEMQNYLEKNWGTKFVELFKSYKKIAHRVDLWRYCILYQKGGIYMDADCILLNDIDFMISKYQMVFVTNNRGLKNIFNGFLMTVPKNPIFKKIIKFMLKTGTQFNDYYFNCNKLYTIIDKYININLSQHIYNKKIKNIDYNILLLIDKRTTIININEKWNEYNKYCAFYNNTKILIECNSFYPYNIVHSSNFKML